MRAVIIMAVAFTAAGVLAYFTVSRAMYAELERQLVEEILLFDEVYQSGGQAALVAAVRKLESPEIIGKRPPRCGGGRAAPWRFWAIRALGWACRKMVCPIYRGRGFPARLRCARAAGFQASRD